MVCLCSSLISSEIARILRSNTGTVADLALGCVTFVLLNTDDYFQADQAIRCVYKFSNVTKKEKKTEEDEEEKTEEDEEEHG